MLPKGVVSLDVTGLTKETIPLPETCGEEIAFKEVAELAERL
jgi:hypothetical protein